MPAAPQTSALMVENLAGLLKAFNVAEKDVKRQGRAELASVARPVQQAEESLAVSKIRNIGAGSPWSQFRIGVTQKLIYVVPRQKGSRGRGRRRRPNLGRLLADRVAGPALERNRGRIERDFQRMCERIAAKWGAGA